MKHFKTPFELEVLNQFLCRKKEHQCQRSCSSMCAVSPLLVVHKEVKIFAEAVVLGSRVGICFSGLKIMNFSLKDSNLLKLS